MKNSRSAPSTTSLPRAPRDEVGARSTRYLLMMGVRVACFILMVVITPYGWYTWVLGAAAVFIPYVAVVLANVGENVRRTDREDPERVLPASPTPRTADSEVIRVVETRPIEKAAEPTPPAEPTHPAEPQE